MEENKNRFFKKGMNQQNLQNGGQGMPKKPKNPVKDAISVTAIGLIFIIVDLIVRYGFHTVIRFKRVVPLYFMGAVIAVVGLVMLIVALVKKNKNKADNPSSGDNNSPGV